MDTQVPNEGHVEAKIHREGNHNRIDNLRRAAASPSGNVNEGSGQSTLLSPNEILHHHEERTGYEERDYFTEQSGSFSNVKFGLRSAKDRSSVNEYDEQDVGAIPQMKTNLENTSPDRHGEVPLSDLKAPDLWESTLGTTLANSLKLISTSNLPDIGSPFENSPSPSIEASSFVDGDPALRCNEDENDSAGMFDTGVQSSDENSPEVANSPDPDTSLDKEPPPKRDMSRRTRGRPRKKPLSKGKEKNMESVAEPTLETSENCVTLFQCEVCYKVFNRKQTLRQHFITHTDRFACSFCKRRCKSKGDLRTHTQTHTKEKPYHCDICKTNYTRESILKKHLTTQLHYKALVAQNKERKPGRRPPSKERLCRELTLSEKARVIGGVCCHVCFKVFLTHKELRMHSRVHSLKHKCTLCNRRCQNAPLLKIHMKCHLKSQALVCNLCSRSFPNQFLLRDHKKAHRNEIKSEKILKTDVLKAAVKKHNKKVEETNESSSKWVCDLCNKCFVGARNLESHIKSHTSQACGMCEKNFPSVVKLNNHMKIHGRAFSYQNCDTSSSIDMTSKQHIESEDKQEMDMTCHICYQIFDSAADLERHMENHAPTMLFSGGCLDENSIPMVNRARKTIPKQETELHSEEDLRRARKKAQPIDKDLEDDDEICRILRTAIMKVELFDFGRDDDPEDSDEEILYSIQKALESDGACSSDDSDTENIATSSSSVLFDRASIEQRHASVFAVHKSEHVEDKTFKCKLCCLFFSEREDLQDHMVRHVCEFCNVFFGERADLSMHKEEHKGQVLKDIAFETKRVVPRQKHVVSDSECSESEGDDESDGFLSELESVLSCKLNGPRFVLHPLSHDDIIRANKRTFERFSCIDTASSIFACIICKRKYARPTTLTRHLKTHVCPYCNQFFEDKMDLLEHKHRHRKAATIKPDDGTEGEKILASPLVTKTNRDLFKKFTLVDKLSNINRCTLCCKNFVRRTVLTRHMKTHICSICDKFYEDKYDLAKHLASHRVQYNKYPEDHDLGDYEAGFVHKPLGSPGLPTTMANLSHFGSAFPVHPPTPADNQTLTFIQLPEDNAAPQMFTATAPGGSTFQIISEPDTNPASFLVTSSGTPGRLTAAGGLFQCGDCGKKFFKEDHLKDHLLVHSKAKPFGCTLCGKSFSKASTMRKHEKTHLKRCKICNAAFSYKYELDLHMEMHRTYTF